MLQVAMEFSSEDTIRTLLTILPRIVTTNHFTVRYLFERDQRSFKDIVFRPYCGIMYCGPRGLAVAHRAF